MNQRLHAALVSFGVADDLFELALLLIHLLAVRASPALDSEAYVLGKIDHGAFVYPELLERLIKDVDFHLCALAHRVLGLRLRGQHGEDAVEYRDWRIVAAEEKVVRVAVGVGVHEDGAAGVSIPPGAADL